MIINEAAAVAAGWSTPEEAIGKGFASPGSGKPEGVVIGVVDDYHQHGLQESVEPIMFGIGPTNRIVLRVDPSQTRAVLGHVSDTWDRFFQGFPYETTFLDEQFKAQYAEQERLAGIFATFSLLTIIVACLGMFGLAMFSVTRRTKEIGIRKALGASGMQIASLVTREFLVLVGVAFLVAVPVAWYLMRDWLDNFAFRMDMGPGLFILTGLIVAGIAIITVSYQALKAASADPIDSLRYE